MSAFFAVAVCDFPLPETCLQTPSIFPMSFLSMSLRIRVTKGMDAWDLAIGKTRDVLCHKVSPNCRKEVWRKEQANHYGGIDNHGSLVRICYFCQPRVKAHPVQSPR